MMDIKLIYGQKQAPLVWNAV